MDTLSLVAAARERPDVGAGALGRPPALAQRRGADHADHGFAFVDEGDQRGPHRHSADKVLGAVDRVDDPAAGTVAGTSELLTEHGVTGTGTGQLAADGLLGGLVRIGDRRQIGLRLDLEVERFEPAHGLVVHGIGQHMGQTQVIVVALKRVGSWFQTTLKGPAGRGGRRRAAPREASRRCRVPWFPGPPCAGRCPADGAGTRAWLLRWGRHGRPLPMHPRRS